MPLILFLVFLVIPLVEIALFVLVGGRIGIFPTLATCVLTALVGAVLVRQQGLATLARLQKEMERGEMPALALGEGLAILASGLLLMTPGFFTDGIGFTLLFPPARRAIVKYVWKYIGGKINIMGMPGGPNGRPQGPPRDANGNIIIDIEAEEIIDPEDDADLDDETRARLQSSQWGRET